MKILLQRKHQRGETVKTEEVFIGVWFYGHVPRNFAIVSIWSTALRCSLFFPACLYNGKTYSHGDMWHPVLGKVLECILCTCTDGLQDCKRITCPSQYPCQHPIKSAGKCCKTCPGSQTQFTTRCWWAVNIIHTTCLYSLSPESKAESNQTQCYLGYKNKLLVYKVESSLKADPPHTVRIIAVTRQSTAEVEVQVWKTVEGTCAN